MSTQSLNDAVKLYEVLGKYAPKIVPEEYLDYLKEILANIRESGNYDAYFYAIVLMTGTPFEELEKSNPEDVLELFIEALTEWHIVELIAFFRNVGYRND
jgi:hypothetical protein